MVAKKMLSNVRSFKIMLVREGLISFNNNNNCASRYREKKYTGAFWGFYFWRIREKIVS